MIVVLLFAQLATTTPAIDSVYSSPAVRELVTAAAAENRRLAQFVPAFRAHVESELALVTQDSIDREMALFTQQHASTVQWKNGSFDVRVTSARPAVRLPQFPGWPGPAWLLPALYGERLPFVFFRSVVSSDRRSQERVTVWDTLAVEHPFERERERRYSFSGGDTSATIHANGRTIPIVHLHVVPRFTADENGAAFEGDIYLDATRKQIVRLRGRFVRALRAGSAGARFMQVTGTTIAPYIDVTNEEVGGQVWLPYAERVEFQFVSALMFGERSIWRFTATFAGHVVDTTGGVQAGDPTAAMLRPTVSYVSEDSLGLPHVWNAPLGAASRVAKGTDFNDVAPPNWRDTGPAQFSMRPSRLSRLFHVDAVEGYFTGLEGTLNFRDVAPGLSLHGFGGWAWREKTARGGGAVAWRRDERTVALHAERSLETTNDFPVDLLVPDPGLAELLGFMQQRDYIDRETAALSFSDIRRSFSDAILSAQIGAGQDRSERTRLTRTPFLFSHDTVLPNRAAANGSYGRLALDYEFHPDLSVGTTLSGVGAQVQYEAATGQLAWQRATIVVRHRAEWGPVLFGERVNAGIVTAPRDLPPQQLFEMGGSSRLSAYSYKQFAGDRAAIGTAGANYIFPMFRTLRLPGAYSKLPPLAPGIGAGVEMGWTALSNNAARAAILAMSDPQTGVPLSVATDGLRGSAGVGFTLFSGLVHVGVAHSFDSGAKWRGAVGLGSTY
jgi:hypothetical protein